ncbi:hypothetical protein E4P42_22555 [Mycobacterium sp. PS03-16]|uniref:hypothetical protein n=1 Tax=Mycobacterium sp. PS03-16 TaxID=2559611 RepID=UPI0010732F74|nr:hypothetical protein [Mycobacterium sp. PS03-16]TFV55509.1 hypothetical protein E4P42_22555 [Mycobacterium sp. PS03-16]
MRRAIAPFLATGVVLSGAAVVVANPVVPMPSDIRVSASDFAADGERLDVLDPGFLDSIGAIRQDWLSSIEVLQRLFTDVANTNRESTVAAFGEALVIPPPALTPTVTLPDTTHERALVAAPTGPVPDPNPVVEGFVGALNDIGHSFGEAGINFVRQVSMAPAVAFVLVQQVAGQLFTGQIGPEEALRRLVVEPLSALLVGHPHLTGIDEIDRAFHESALKPLIRALIRNLPKPIGQPGGLIDDVDHTVDGVVVEIRDGLTPAQKPQQAASGVTAETPPVSGDIEELEPATSGTVGEQQSVGDPDKKAPATLEPGAVAQRIGKEINRALDDFRATVKRFSAGNRKDAPTSGSGKSDDPGQVEGDEPANGSAGDAPDADKPDNAPSDDGKPADGSESASASEK